MPTPHFDLPLRYAGGQPVVNEQDSAEDLGARVLAACLAEPGSLPADPEFGLPDQTFSNEPISRDALVQAISSSEPDVTILAEVAPDQFDASIVRANLQVTS